MPESLKPTDAGQLADILKWAVAEETPLEVTAGGSKRDLGRPSQASHRLDLSALAGIDEYEPEELVLTCKPGTPLTEIEKALAERDQHLGFEPPDLGPLLGGKAGRQTLGGVLACNLSGPRRIAQGAARDHFLGLAAVSGRGEPFRSGGRVVKNVTGYDLSKLLAGSYGTLAALTEVTVKVLPVPEKTRTVLVSGLDDDAAAAMMSEAMRSEHVVSAAAHLPPGIAARSAVERVAGAGKAVTALRVEGPGHSVEHRCAALIDMFRERGGVEELHSRNSIAFWRELRDVMPFVGRDGAVWRVSVAPTAGHAVAARIAAHAGVELFYDWAGGLLWVCLPEGEDAGAGTVRGAIPDGGGHATLIRAPAAVRAAVPVFQPQPEALAALTRRVKESFDPKGVLNPGRMYAGV